MVVHEECILTNTALRSCCFEEFRAGCHFNWKYERFYVILRRVKKVAENEVMDVRNSIPAAFDNMKCVAVELLSILACTH